MTRVQYVVDDVTAVFEPLSPPAINIALGGEATRERHDLALAEIPAFQALEYQPPGRPSVKKLKRLDLHRQMLGQVNDLSQSINKLNSTIPSSKHDRGILRKMKDRRKKLFEKLAYEKS